MEREYQVRLYRSGDEEQIVWLLQTGFGVWPQFDVSCEPIELLSQARE